MKENKSKGDIQEEDHYLIKSFLNNDRSAFDRLVLKYKDKVFNLCFRINGDYDDASDCSQETFIKVYNSLANFKFRSSFSTWLYRIAVNTCKNNISSLTYRMKKKMTRLDDPGNRISQADNDYRLEISDNSFAPDTAFEKKERELIIQNAVNSLKGTERILIVLCDIEGKSYEEIVDITGINIGTVKSKLFRARQELRERLRGVI